MNDAEEVISITSGSDNDESLDLQETEAPQERAEAVLQSEGIRDAQVEINAYSTQTFELNFPRQNHTPLPIVTSNTNNFIEVAPVTTNISQNRNSQQQHSLSLSQNQHRSISNLISDELTTQNSNNDVFQKILWKDNSKKRMLLDDEEVEQFKEDDGGNTCPICFEPWTSSGPNRVVALFCGHLFCKSCVNCLAMDAKSKHHSKKKSRSKIIPFPCPICKSSSSDCLKICENLQYISLYPQAVLLCADNSLLEEIKKNNNLLSVENQRLKTELINEKLFNQKYLKDIENLQAQLVAKDNEQLSQNFSARSNLINFSSMIPFDIPLAATPGSVRCILFLEERREVLVGIGRSFSNYGFFIIELEELFTFYFANVHRDAIRSIKQSPFDKSLILSASLDKTLKLTNLNSKNIVHSYSLPTAVWSCEFDNSNYVFDIRHTTGPIKIINDLNLTSSLARGIHSSLTSVKENGIIGAGLGGVFFLSVKENNASQNLEFDYKQLSVESTKLINTAVVLQNDMLMSTFRMNPTGIKIVISKILHKGDFERTEIKHIDELKFVEYANRSLSKPAIFNDAFGNIIFSFIDEFKQKIMFYEVDQQNLRLVYIKDYKLNQCKGQGSQSNNGDVKVFDTGEITIRGLGQFVGVVGENYLNLFKFN
ncbi:hypothetical protein HDU92_000932 [Lobulomyces angularis]|nr:hypothetical protein HDU92_000932 [Lobulomyces angularis]